MADRMCGKPALALPWVARVVPSANAPAGSFFEAPGAELPGETDHAARAEACRDVFVFPGARHNRRRPHPATGHGTPG